MSAELPSASKYAQKCIDELGAMDVAAVRIVGISPAGSCFVVIEHHNGSHAPLMIPASQDMPRAEIYRDGFCLLPDADDDLLMLARSTLGPTSYCIRRTDRDHRRGYIRCRITAFSETPCSPIGKNFPP